MITGLRRADDDFTEALDCIAAGNLDEALVLLAKVVAFDSTNHEAYELWVACHTTLGRYRRAIELADEGLRRGIAPWRLNLEKARAFRGLEQFEEAAHAAETALEIDPVSTQAVLSLAVTRILQGKREVAVEVYRGALLRNPDDADVAFALLRLFSEAGNDAAAIETARDYLRRFEKNAEVLAMLGQAYLARGDCKRADRAFRDASELEPDVVDHHVNILLVALLTKNESLFEKYLERLAIRDEELAERVAEETELLLDRLTPDHDSGDEGGK
jgi:tetratricopeptide (TPR) repeat protein